METKVCYKCGEEKPIEEFALNKARKDGHNGMCKSCFKQYRDTHYINNKQYYINKATEYKKARTEEFYEYKKHLKCSICGESRWWLLDFHHLDPKEKETEVYKLVEAPNKIKSEIAKCIVLCANCHRDLHFKERHKE